MLIKIEELDTIISDLSKESFSSDMDLDIVDEFVIDFVIPIKQNKNIVENIIYLENYTPE